jgi:hypothetical protein
VVDSHSCASAVPADPEVFVDVLFALWDGGPGLGRHIPREAGDARPEPAVARGRRGRRLGRWLHLRLRLSSRARLRSGKDRSHGAFPPYCRDRHVVCSFSVSAP